MKLMLLNSRINTNSCSLVWIYRRVQDPSRVARSPRIALALTISPGSWNETTSNAPVTGNQSSPHHVHTLNSAHCDFHHSPTPYSSSTGHQNCLSATAAREAPPLHHGTQNSLLGRHGYVTTIEMNALRVLFSSPDIHLIHYTGVATRLGQLAIEMRPFFQRGGLWVYPMFAGIGGSFGYWLKGVEDRQMKMLAQRKQTVIEKRRRRAEREERDFNATEVSTVDGAMAS